MDNSPERYVERLIEILEKKYGFLETMLRLTQEQAKVIGDDNIDALEKLITQKQAQIDLINKLDEEFDIYYKRFKSCLGVKSLNDYRGSEVKGIRELKEITSRIMGTVEKISELESDNSLKAKKILENTGKELKNINQGKQVSRAYKPAPSSSSSSYFIDKKS